MGSTDTNTVPSMPCAFDDQCDASATAMVRLARWAATVEAIHVEADAKGLAGPRRDLWIASRRAECLEPF